MGLKILIVDDSLTIRIALKRLMGLLDAELEEVLEAGDGRAGLEQMRAKAPDLVLADLNMEGMSGQEMITQMRADADLARIPVVVISSEGSRAVLDDLAPLGIQSFIRKPFEMGEVSEVLERALASRFALAQ